MKCFKHYCRSCGAVEHVRAGQNADYPRCCNRSMAYLGQVDAEPGRIEKAKKATPAGQAQKGEKS